ncbi:hypothetical protein ABFU82_22410 [Nocardioides sp. WV_118_6]
MTTPFKPTTQLELIDRITHVECGTCGTRADAVGANLIAAGSEDIDDLLALATPCCVDPVPDWLIVSETPLFDDPAIDDGHEIRRLRSDIVTWEYTVDHALAECVGVTA